MGKKGKGKTQYSGQNVDHAKQYLKYKKKYLDLKSHQTGGFWFGGDDTAPKSTDRSSDLSNWIHQEKATVNGIVVEQGPVAYYSEMVSKYGEPTYCVNQAKGVCRWIKGHTKKDISPHEMIVLEDEFVKHEKPQPHYDFMYSIVKVYVPPEKLVDVLKISGSINYDPLLNHLRARCGSFAANFATFKTAFDVIEGKGAEYGKEIGQKEEQEKSNEELVTEKVNANQKQYAAQLNQAFYPIDQI